MEIGNKLVRLFGNKQVFIRTNSFSVTPDGSEGLLVYEGYFLDCDETFIYLSHRPEYETISTAVKIETIEEVTLVDEEHLQRQGQSGQVLSLVKEVKNDEEV